MIVQLDYKPAEPGVWHGPIGHCNLIDLDGTIQSLDRPFGTFTILERPSFAQQLRRSRAQLVIAGGFNDNMVVTDQRQLLRHYITPMSEVILEGSTPAPGEIGIEPVAGGSGPTGLCIFWLRWLDSVNARRSPFSESSPTLNLDGTESIRFHGVPMGPQVPDIGVDKVEVWVARNGAARRRLATRDVGVPMFTITESIEYEVETVENLQKAPRCRFNDIYNDRYWQSGDVNHPERIYFSPPERLTDYAGGYLVTRKGEAVTGMKTIRGVLVVFCAQSSYYISGYSEGDFQVLPLEPGLGCLSHHGIAMVHDFAIVPNHLGLYACSGTSMQLIGGSYTTMWTEMYSENPAAFEMGFAINDKRSKVYKFFEEQVTLDAAGVPTFGNGRYWVLDYKSFSIKDGGSSAEPYLSFDLHAARPKCAAMVAAPGGKAGDCFTGFAQIAAGEPNRIVKENQWQVLDQVGDFTTIIQPALQGYEPEGGPHDGINALEGWLLVHYQMIDSWLLELIHGPERAAVRSAYSWALSSMFDIPQASPPGAGGGREIIPEWASWDKTDPNSTFSPSALTFKIGLTGEGFGPRLAVVNPIGLVWSGWGFTHEAGKAFLAKHV